MLCVLISTVNIQLLCRRSIDFPELAIFASRSGAMINLHWLELPMARTLFHGPKGVRAIEVRLYCGKEEKLLLRSNFSSFPQYFQYVPNFRSQIIYSFVKCGCLLWIPWPTVLKLVVVTKYLQRLSKCLNIRYVSAARFFERQTVHITMNFVY